MIIYLRGPDSYCRNLKLNRLLGEYRLKNKEIDYLLADFEEDGERWIDVVDFLSQPSLFLNSKLVVVKEIGGVLELDNFKKNELKKFKNAFKNCLKSEKIFVIISSKDGPEKEFDFLSDSSVITQNFDTLVAGKLEAFLRIESEKRGVYFDDRSWSYFMDYVSSFADTSWRGIQELEKISLAGFSNPISLKNLKQIISWTASQENYKLAIELLQSNTFDRRLAYLEFILSLGNAPRYILNLLSSLARNKNDVLSLAKYDELIKSGEMDDDAALLGFALSIPVI